MFKFDAVVRLVLVGSLIGSTPAAMAERDSDRRSRSYDSGALEQCKASRNKYEKLDEDYDKASSEADRKAIQLKMDRQMKAWKDCLKDARPDSTASSGCREASTKFSDSIGKFSGACKNAGLSNDNGGEKGTIACSWSMNRCACLSKKISDDDKDRYQCEKLDSSSRSNDGMIDIAAAAKRMEYCPQHESDDTDRYEKQLERAQERMKAAKEKMPKLLDKGSEGQDKLAEKQNEVRRKAGQIQKEYAKKLQEIKKKKSADEQEAVAELNQVRAKMDEAEAQVRQLENQKLDAQLQYSEAKVQVELNCHTQASQAISAKQAAKLASIRAGQPSGDFNELMKGVGVSSREAWQKQAEIEYRRCVASRPTRESKDAARKRYESAVRAIDGNISTARQARNRLEQSIGQIISARGCAAPTNQPGMPSGESKLCRGIREANEEAVQAYSEAVTSQAELQAEAATNAQAAQVKNQGHAREFNELQNEFNDEQRRIKNFQEYLDLKREARGGKKGGEKLDDAYGELTAAADKVISCAKTDKGSVSPETTKRAADFLTSLGQDVGDYSSSFDVSDDDDDDKGGEGQSTREPAPSNDPPDNRSRQETQR